MNSKWKYIHSRSLTGEHYKVKDGINHITPTEFLGLQVVFELSITSTHVKFRNTNFDGADIHPKEVR